MQEPKLRVVHLVNQLSFDGSSKVVMQLCRQMSQHYEIHVVSLTLKIDLATDKDWPADVKVAGFDFYFDPDYSFRRYLTLYFRRGIIQSRAAKITEFIGKLQPAIIHCHLQPRELLILKPFFNTGKRLIYTDHSVRLKHGEYPAGNLRALAWLYRRIYCHFHVVAVAVKVEQCHRTFRLLDSRRVHRLIENALDTDAFSMESKKLDPPAVIYVARLEPKKGHDTLLKAWKIVETSCIAQLLIVGDGVNAAALRDLASQLELVNVKFLGNRSDIPEILGQASIAAFPSLHEGLPIALLEKMAAGLPVIVSDIPELTAIVHDGVSGIHFKTGNPDDLANKILHILNDGDLAQNLGSNARHFVQTRYGIGRLRDQYLEFYREVLNTPVP